MSLSFGISPFLLVLCLLAAAGLTYWTYRRTTPPLSLRRRVVLGGLRFLALTLLLFLLFEPIFRRVITRTHPPTLAVLIDESQSLGLVQEEVDGQARDLAATVRDALRQIPTASLGGNLRFFAFSDDVRPLPGEAPPLDSLRFDGERTNIARALEVVSRSIEEDHLRGVLLVTDGQYNTGRNPLYLAERFPVPIYTVAVGDSTAHRDLQIRRVATNEIAYVGARLPIQVGLRVKDFGGEQVNVTVLQGGEVLQTAPVTLPEGTAEIPVDLYVTPESVGLIQFEITVTRLPGELTYRNNVERVTVQVLENKRRVLLFAAPPNPDLAALRQLLSRDEHLEIQSFTQRAPGRFYEGQPPARLEEADLILLAGYPGPGADRALLDRIRAAAEAGTPLLFLYHRTTDLRALQLRLGDVLPVKPGRVRSGTVETAFVPTPAGLRHPILDLSGRSPTLYRRLPPLLASESRWEPAPDARVLAVTEVRGIPLQDPLLVVQQRSGRRTAALLGDGTWRWKNVPEDLEDIAPLWPVMLDHLLQWVATREDDRPVRVRPVEQVFGGGEEVQLTGQVYDESLNPVPDATLEVDVEAPDGTRFPFQMEALGEGRYLLNAGTMPEGTYRYTARATREGETLGTDTGTFAVGPLTLEYKETRANTALLRQIADRSGGTFFLPDQLDRLPEHLSASGLFTPITVEEARETRLWQRYPFLVFILLLLTTEWFLRKRSGMV